MTADRKRSKSIVTLIHIDNIVAAMPPLSDRSRDGLVALFTSVAARGDDE